MVINYAHLSAFRKVKNSYLDHIFIYERSQLILNLPNSESSSIDFFSADEKPYGIAFGQWTVRWWKWLLSFPKSINPATDENGKDSSLNQCGPVWFLAGTFGENKAARRKCAIPRGKCVLFPVINYEVNFLEKPEITSDEELVKDVVDDQNDIINIVAELDDEKVLVYRVQSDPKLFHVDLPAENCLDLSVSRVKIASDGYWVFLKPLSTGVHKIFFHGSCSGGIRTCTAFYDLTIL
jgi:hypothetical protein